jgi:putative membrane protein
MHHHAKKALLGAFLALAVAFGVMAAPASAHDRRGGDRHERRHDAHERRQDRQERWDRHDRRDWDGRDRDRRDRVSEDDLAFIATAAGIALSEVHEGNVAMQRGSHPLVQEHGRRMVVDHFVQLYDLLPFMRQHDVELPVLSEEQLARLTELTSAPEESFDGVYVALQIEAHEAAIEVFETAADDADSRKVRKFAKAQLPHLHQHLDAARVIQGVVGEPEPVA